MVTVRDALIATAHASHPFFEVLKHGKRVAVVPWCKTDSSVDSMRAPSYVSIHPLLILRFLH